MTTHSVVIVTWRRPEHVARCLSALAGLEIPVHEVLVVDASEDDLTERATAASDLGRSGVARHISFPEGAGHMTTARNAGLVRTSGELISFLDDDVEVASCWAGAVRREAADGAAAVAGRVTNGDPGEADTGLDEIGTIRADGTITGNFAAEPPGSVRVDHGIGANMSFTRRWLAQVGGFRDVFPGTAMREDTDMFTRVRHCGGTVVFAPDALARNSSGPHVVGRRFDLRYTFWSEYNHAIFLTLNFGLAPKSRTWRYLRQSFPGALALEPERRRLSRVVRAVTRWFAFVLGLVGGARIGRVHRHAVRSDATGRAITHRLMSRTQ